MSELNTKKTVEPHEMIDVHVGHEDVADAQQRARIQGTDVTQIEKKVTSARSRAEQDHRIAQQTIDAIGFDQRLQRSGKVPFR